MNGIHDRRRVSIAIARALGCALAGAVVSACSKGAETLTTSALSPGQTEGKVAAQPRVSAPVKIGLLLPLSAGGATSIVARAMQQAAELAMFDRPGIELQIILKDDKGTPEGARAAAEEAIKAGAEIIVGPLFAKSVKAVSAVGAAANVPVIAFSNDPEVAGRGVYLLTFLSNSEIRRVVDYSATQGRKRFAAFLPEDAFGRSMEAELQASVTQIGGELVTVEWYGATASGMVEPVQRLRKTLESAAADQIRVDALFIPAVPDTVAQLAAIVPQLGDVKPLKLIGTSAWDTHAISQDARLEGLQFAATDPNGWREFSSRFALAHKVLPPRIASLAFDAIGVAATFAHLPPGQRFTAANLTRPAGFNGADGPFRLTSSGLVERSLAVLELQKTGSVVIDAVPASAGGGAQAVAPPLVPLPDVN